MVRNKRLDLRRVSVVADMIVDRAHPKIKLPDLIQADFLGFLSRALLKTACSDAGGRRPSSMRVVLGHLDLFGRATTPQGLKALSALFRVKSLGEFHQLFVAFSKSELLQVYHQRNFMNRISLAKLTNIVEIEQSLKCRQIGIVKSECVSEYERLRSISESVFRFLLARSNTL